jgi:type I restriction enzyme S subunit
MAQSAQANLFSDETTVVQEPWRLPSGWQWMPLGKAEVTEIIMGQSPPGESYNTSGEGLPFFQGKAEFGEYSPLVAKWCTDPKKIALPGDILISVRAPVGPTNLVNERCCIGRGLAALRPARNILTRYLLYAVRVREAELSGYGKGSTFAAINKDELSAFTIPVPFPDDPLRSLDIQRRIVTRLEALLAELKEMRSLATTIRRDTDRVMEAALEEVFGKIRRGFEVTGIPKNQIKSIENVAKLERGKFSHRPRNDRRFFGGAIPWVQIQNIPRDYSKYITDYMNTLNESGLAISRLFPTGTLVVSIAATIGEVGILGFDACFPDSLVGITPDDSQITAGFLYWQLCYAREHLDAIAPAAAQKNVNLQILGRINLWVPPLHEQKIIDAHLDAVQEEIGEMRRLQIQDTELLNQVEQSILERAFRGEL